MRWMWGIAVLATVGGCYWTQAPPPRIALIPAAPVPAAPVPALAAPSPAPERAIVCEVVPLPTERIAYREVDASVRVCVVDELGAEVCRRELAAVYDAERRRCGPRESAPSDPIATEPAVEVVTVEPVSPAPLVRPAPIRSRPTYHAPTYHGGPVHVRGYYRRDGTYVRPHTRRRRR